MSVCNHSFTLSVEHPDYDRCLYCGTYRHRCPSDPSAVYTADYWSEAKGHSTIDDQVYNITGHKENGRTKLDAIVRMIGARADRGAALEIGCAPGIVLRHLFLLGYWDIHGVEVIPEWAADIRRIAGFDAALHFGLFPEVTRSNPGGRFDLVLAMDVFEHSPRPWPFILECARLLTMGGQFVMMAPLVTSAYSVPDRMFCDEHIWIHSLDNLAALLWQAGFHSVNFDSWCEGHETVSAIKGEMPEGRLRAA